MNDRKDFDRIFTHSYEALLLFALKLVRDEEAAKDIVNDAFEYFWKHFAAVNENTVKTWLFTVVKTKSIDYLRRQANAGLYTDFASRFAERFIEMELPDTDPRLLAISKAMDKLTPYNRMILEECYLNGKKYKQLAAELGVSVAAIHKNIVKALRIIRETVGTRGNLKASRNV